MEKMNNKNKKYLELLQRMPYGVKVYATGWDDDADEEISIISEVHEINSDGYLRLKEDESGYQYHLDDVQLVLCSFDEISDDAKSVLMERVFGKRNKRYFQLNKDGSITEKDKEVELDHFEIHYPTFSPQQCDIYVQWCFEYNVDFRGSIKSGDAIDVSSL